MFDTTSPIESNANGGAAVTVAVGHTSTLVAAGLESMLRRVPGCRITLSRISPEGCDSCRAGAQVIFGDSALLKCRRERAKSSTGRCALASARFVLVTAGDEPVGNAKAAGEIEERLSIESPEHELFAVVRRVIGFDDARSNPASAAARPNAAKAPGGTGRPTARGGLAPGALRRVREYIEQHFTEKVQTQDLARIAGLSLGHFNRAFRESTGCSPHRFLMRQRIAIATELLKQTSRALADIALDAGFADQSHFSRMYAAATGETPSACRRRHR